MTPNEFRDRWIADDDELMSFGESDFVSTNVPADAKTFLLGAGLPSSAAPFLEFDGSGNRRFQPVTERFPAPSELGNYLCIGFGGSGDPICICGSTGHVAMLNHDDNFRPVLMNTSIVQLAESLLVFRHLVDATCAAKGDDAYLDGDVPPHLIQYTRDEIATADSAAMQEGCFWRTELATLEQMA